MTDFPFRAALAASALLIVVSCTAPEPAASRIEEHVDFPSAFVAARNVEVYLPPGYDAKKSYPVLYMHDGGNLFQTGRSWTGDEWGVDEALDTLGFDWIVVAPWNTGLRRFEYMPAKPRAMVEDSVQAMMARDSTMEDGELLADAYLRFLVEELKPWVDTHYATKPDRANTMIAGSSMGGLISCYAMGEYPEVFGQAACISTLWPALNGVFLYYLADANVKPHPEGSRIWMDHGTETLDALYAPFQANADSLMLGSGWKKGINWESRIYPGAAHDENSWRARLPDVFDFLAQGIAH